MRVPPRKPRRPPRRSSLRRPIGRKPLAAARPRADVPDSDPLALDGALLCGGAVATPLATPLAALQGTGEGTGDLGARLAEKVPGWLEDARRFKDTALGAADDPLVVVVIVAVVVALIAAAVLAPAALYHARAALRARPQDLVVADRREEFVDNVVSMPLTLRWKDRCSHVQCLGPTGSGKTYAILPWIVQDLLAGRSVAIVQIHGDLADWAIAYADAMGATAHVCDFSDDSSLKLNLLAGENTQKVANRAASAVRAVASQYPHYQNVAEEATRRFVILARSWAAHMGGSENDADIELWRWLLYDRPQLDRVLGVVYLENENGRRTGGVRVNAPWLDHFTATWFEQRYLVWSETQRENNLAGVEMFLNRILSEDAARRRMCPGVSDPELDLYGELRSTAGHLSGVGPDIGAGGAGANHTLGKLIVVKAPVEAMDVEPARAIAYWALKTVQDATLTRREDADPLCVYLDELPTLIGKGHREEVDAFAGWLANVRKLGVAVHVAYQGYSLLGEVLVGNLDTNGRNVLILGGLAERDIRKVQRSLGEEQDVEDERVTSGAFGTETVTSRGRRRQEKPSMSFDELKYMRRGEGLWMGVKENADQKPVKTRSRHLKPPDAYRKYQTHRADRRAPRRKARR